MPRGTLLPAGRSCSRRSRVLRSPACRFFSFRDVLYCLFLHFRTVLNLAHLCGILILLHLMHMIPLFTLLCNSIPIQNNSHSVTPEVLRTQCLCRFRNPHPAASAATVARRRRGVPQGKVQVAVTANTVPLSFLQPSSGRVRGRMRVPRYWRPLSDINDY